MRLLLALLVLAVWTVPVYANTTQTFWLLELNDWHTWCGYTALADFKAEADKLQPSRTVRVTLRAAKLVNLTYQIEAESGDWVVIDKYTPFDNGLLLKRANLLVQPQLEIIQETTIHGQKVLPLRVISVKRLGANKGQAKINISTIDFPPVKIMTNVSKLPFMEIISEMQTQNIRTLCKKVE